MLARKLIKMKASEVLKEYAAGERNFQRVNLAGQSFKGQNLSNVDFREANIRSTNFVKANLTRANFQEARCGLESRWERLQIILSFLLAAISGVTSSLALALVSLIANSESSNRIAGWIGLSVLIIFVIVTIYKGIRVFMAVGAIAFTLAGAVAITIAIGIGIETDALTVAAVMTVSITLAVVSAVVAATTAALTVSIITILRKIGSVFVVGGVILGTIFGANVLAVARTGTIELIIFSSLVLTAINTHIGWRILRGDKRDAWVHSIAIAFTAIKGTSFRNADLTDANFSQAILKSTDFREANLTRTCWQNAQKLDRVRTRNTYLKNAALRRLLTTGYGKDQNFDRQDLRGVNLS
ncbi:MAG: pentapeptide repeat-containing protein [Cyanobacteria bacterium P01_E01_bin.35]